MAESEFIEGLSDKALKELQAYNAELTKTVAGVKDINTALGSFNTPSGANSFTKKLAEDAVKSQKAIANLQSEIGKAVTAQKKSVALTQQEKTDIQLLNVEKRREAILNSQVAGEYRKLSTSVAIASDKYQNLIARGKTAEQTQRQYNRELRVAQKEFQSLQTKVLQADKAVDKWSRTNQRSVGLFKDLLGAFGIVGGVTAIAMITKDIFEQTKEIMSLNNALKLVTETQENFYSQQAFISRISEAYGADINSLTKQFTQFYVSAKDKISGSEIQDIFESVTKAGASMGLSVESQERAFLALNQMMSKGTITAEELKGQLGEALPGAFGILAKALNVNEQQLGKLMKDGKIIASEVLPKFAKQLEITYGIENVKRVENLAAAQNRMANAWRGFVANLEEDGNTLSKVFGFLIDQVTINLKLITRLFTSTETLRKQELRSLKASGEEQAKNDLKRIESDEKRKKYASERIIELNEEKQAIKANIDAVIAKNKAIVSRETKVTPFGEVISKEGENATKENRKELAKLSDQYQIAQGKIIGYSQALQAKKTLTEEDTELTKEQIKAEQDRLRQVYENRKTELELELYYIDKTLDDEEKVYGDRIIALNLHRKKRLEILALQFKEEMRLAGSSYEKQKAALLNFQFESEKEIDTIRKKEEAIKSLVPVGVVLVDTNKDLADSAKSATKAFEDQQKALKKTEESIEAIAQAMRDYRQSFVEDFLQSAGFETLFDIISDRIIGFGEDWATTLQATMELAQEAFNFISELSNQRFQNEYDNLERERDVALEFAGDNAAGREEIERQFRERRKAIELREFEVKKQQAKANILIDLAQAVIGLYKDYNYVTATVLGAILTGVAIGQIATVNSQQPPAYEHGTENHLGGAALINDGKGANYKELVITPDGKARMFNERNKKVVLPKGTIVKPAYSMESLMFNDGLNNILLNNGISNAPATTIDFSSVEKRLDDLNETIKNKPTSQTNIDKNGINHLIRNGHTTKEDFNSKIHFQSKGV